MSGITHSGHGDNAASVYGFLFTSPGSLTPGATEIYSLFAGARWSGDHRLVGEKSIAEAEFVFAEAGFLDDLASGHDLSGFLRPRNNDK
jgi:hypothetical protein